MRRKTDPTWNFKAVGAEVPGVTKACMEKFGVHAAEIILNWRQIAGAALAGYTTPLRIRWARRPDMSEAGDTAAPARPQKTALEILVDGGRAHEIPYRAPQIIERINGYFGYRAVTEVRSIAGDVTDPPPAAAKVPPRTAPGQAGAGSAARELALVDDPALHAALARLGAGVKRGRG